MRPPAEGGGEPHGDRYGQLADWIGVTIVGSGAADDPSVAFVGGIAAIRSLRWWAWWLSGFVRHRGRHEPPAAPDPGPERPSER